MTRPQIPFIGRQDTIQAIQACITEEDTQHLICIHGEGGLGKTRLLQEILVRTNQADDHRFAILQDILDFDDLALCIPGGIWNEIARLLSKELLAPYLEAVADARSLEASSVRRERVVEQKEKATKAFVGAVANMHPRQRWLVVFDTVDGIGGRDREHWDDIVRLSQYLPNSVVIVAGREAREFYNYLAPGPRRHARLVELAPFSQRDREIYLRHKTRLLRFDINKSMAQKILELSRGKPILIDLAADWISRNIPLPWLTALSLDEVHELSSEEQVRYQEEFEKNLVQHVGELRTSADQLILVLAHVFPLDAKGIEAMLAIPEAEAADLLQSVSTYAFVKTLPDGKVQLHDEMRRIVNRYVWPSLDPDGNRLRRDSSRAATYFQNEYTRLRAQLEGFHRFQHQHLDLGVLPQIPKANTQAQETLEREKWIFAEQWLGHLLEADAEKGFAEFEKLFEEGTTLYPFSVRDPLIKLGKKFRGQLTAPHQAKLDILEARHSLDSRDYEETQDRLTRLLGQQLTLEDRAHVLIEFGNLLIRKGNITKAIERFEEAVSLSVQNGLVEWHLRALNALGWGNRLMGRTQRAVELYGEALELSYILGDKKRRAWILNNLGFVSAQEGKFVQAMEICRQAEALWKEIDYDRGFGALYQVYGQIYTTTGEFDKAIEYYHRALGIFEPARDWEWICRVSAAMGVPYRHLRYFGQAEQALLRALGIGIKMVEPEIYHWLAHVYEYQQEFDKAQEYFCRSLTISEEVGSLSYELNNHCDLLGLALRSRQWFALEQTTSWYHEFKAKWPDVDFPRAEGQLLTYMGDMLFCRGFEEVDQALVYYEHGLPLLANSATLKPYTVSDQLARLERLLEELRCPRDRVQVLGARLYDLWREKGLIFSHAELLPLLLGWKTEGLTIRVP